MNKYRRQTDIHLCKRSEAIHKGLKILDCRVAFGSSQRRNEELYQFFNIPLINIVRFFKVFLLGFLFCFFVPVSCMKPNLNLPIATHDVLTVDDFVINEDTFRFYVRWEADEILGLNQKQETLDHSELQSLLEQVLSKLITDYSILAYGKKHHVEIPPGDLKRAVRDREKRFDPQKLEKILLEKNIPYSCWKQKTETEIRVRYVLDQMLFKDLQPTESEVETYYNLHRTEFEIPLLDNKHKVQKNLLEVAPQISEKLFQEKLQKKYSPWLQTVTREVTITVKKELLEDFTL